MGALRKTAPEIVQPTQIIIFPVDHAQPLSKEGPSAWDSFKESDAGSLILFEVKMFGMVAVAAVAIALAGWFGYSAKTAAGIDVDPNFSYSGLSHQLQESNWKPAHYLN
ncbi:MAG: hypothetical protein ACKVQS_10770 [Fimbriimonadaceae bacterium]